MTTDHDHAAGFKVEGYTDPAGRRVDHALLSRVVGAAVDGCASCQDEALTRLDDAPGLSSPEFRRLARAGLDGANTEMFAACKAMTPTQRRAAANTALDNLVGHLLLGD